MDALLTQQKAITLGEILVRELDEHPQADSLSRWMAHYIGEQMAIAAATTGDAKAEAEARCFQTILALWSHRAKLLNGFRPFDGFEPILKTLARLDPDEARGFYRNFQLPQGKEAASDEQQKAVSDWVEFVESIDYTARILIDLALQAAAHNATRDSTEAVLMAALADDQDVTILRRLRQLDEPATSPDTEAAKARVERLERHIDRLRWFKSTTESAEKVLTQALAKAKQLAVSPNQ
jgi:hypothetical protein